MGALIGTIFIISSYALYSYTGSSLAFDSTINKRVKTTISNLTGGRIEGSFADKIIKNNTLQTGTPNFSKGYPNNTDKDSSKSGLYKTIDNEGDTYYFRGDKNLLNNNVKFAGMNWKIVRINGDGTIRMILAEDNWNNIKSIGNYKYNNYTYNSDNHAGKYTGFTYDNKNHNCIKDNPCEVTYSNGQFNNNNFGGTNSNVKRALEEWYSKNLNSVDNKIASGYFCNDTSYGSGNEDATDSGYLKYGVYDRINNNRPNLQCPDPKSQSGQLRTYGGIYKTKIGLITADEMNMAGLTWHSPFVDEKNYLRYDDFWSMSPHYSDSQPYVFVNSGSYLDNADTGGADAVVPVINLKADTPVTGTGTSGNPYQVVDGNTYFKEGNYKEEQIFKVYENEGYVYGSTSCTNGANASYNTNTKTLTVNNQTKDTVCTVTFNETLKHGIIANNTIKTDIPDFSIGEPPNDGSITSTGSGLFKTTDDQGDSYYFRGNKNELNNNVKFAGMNWKIVRINGDGTIRLILADNNWNIHAIIENTEFSYYESIPSGERVGFTGNNTTPCTKSNPCEVTYNNWSFSNSKFGGKNSDVKIKLEEWYYNNLKNYDSKIASGYFCNDTSYGSGTEESTLYYGAYERIRNKYQPNLKCPEPNNINGVARSYGGIYKTKIGLLTADEMSMAGLSYHVEATKSNYLYYDDSWWSMSPDFSTDIMFEGFYGEIDQGTGSNEDSIVPVINLKADTRVTGEGTTISPFVVN